MSLKALTATALQTYETDLDELTLNVKASPYNAVGDGVTNDTSAIQAALNSLATSGGNLYFPTGTYSAGNLQVPSNVRIFGAGMGATTIKFPASMAVASNTSGADLATFLRFGFVNNQGGGTGNSNITIHDLSIDGNVSNGNAVNEFYFGIAFYGVTNGRVYNVRAQNLRGEGIYVSWDGNVESSHFQASNIFLYNVGVDAGAGNARQGISIIQCRRFTIRDVHANLCGGPANSYIVDVEPNVAADVCVDGTIEGLHGFDCSGGVSVTMAVAGNTSGIHIDDITMRDGPTNTITSCVAVTRADNIHIGPRIYSDVAPASMTSGKRIWLDDSNPPTNVTVVNLKKESQTRSATTAVQQDTKICQVTGSGAISAMGKSWVGHEITFSPANGVTFTDGTGTLRLTGNFAPVNANSTLSIICLDGTNWHETGRADNG